MSDVVEKTLAAIPRLISSSLLGGKGGGGDKDGGRPQPQVSRELEALVRAVDGARGRSQEAALIQQELVRLKDRLREAERSTEQMCRLLPTVIFCHIMGYDVSFAQICALKLAGMGKGQAKRAGYLACTILLTPRCDVAILLLSSLLRSLLSSSILDNIMALSAAAELIDSEYIPMVLEAITKLLKHREASVRARAVSCLDVFYRHEPELMRPVLPQVKSMLGDKDPNVLSSVVTMIVQLPQEDLAEFVPLGPALFNILQQVRANKFGDACKYHGIPLPWLQIKLLQALSRLASVDIDLALQLTSVLSQMLDKINDREPIMLAIVEECLVTISALAKACSEDKVCSEENANNEEKEGEMFRSQQQEHGSLDDKGKAPSSERVNIMSDSNRERQSKALASALEPLLGQATRCVGRLLQSHSTNLRYLGVRILAQLTSARPHLAAPHQIEVVQCLSDPDPIVRRTTLTLLHNMANRDNVEAVCSAMLSEIGKGGQDGAKQKEDVKLKADLAEMVCGMAGKFAPSVLWYLDICLLLLALQLDSQHLSSMFDKMLCFLIQAAQSGNRYREQFGAVGGHLLTVFIHSSQQGQGLATPQRKFILNALRFVPISVPKEVFSEHGAAFLITCAELVESESVTVNTKDEVVLCVQELMLRKGLPRQEVLAWVNALVNKLNLASTSRKLRQKLSELSSLSSTSTELSSLAFAPDTDSTGGASDSKAMDFGLSFLDAYVLEACKEDRYFPKPSSPQRKNSETAGDQSMTQSWLNELTSPGSQHSNQSSGGGGLYPGVTSYAESQLSTTLSSQSPNSGQTVLSSLPEAKKVWSKDGFVGETHPSSGYSTSVAERGKQKKEVSASSSVMGGSVHGQTQSAENVEDGEKKKLAQALFQGISFSPSVSATQRQASSSLLLEDTSSLISSSSSSGSSQSRRADADNTTSVLPVSLSSQQSAGNGSQAKLVNSHMTVRDSANSGVLLSEETTAKARQSQSASQEDEKWTELPSSADTGGWKALHASQTENSHSSKATESSRFVAESAKVAESTKVAETAKVAESSQKMAEPSDMNTDSTPATSERGGEEDQLLFSGKSKSKSDHEPVDLTPTDKIGDHSASDLDSSNSLCLSADSLEGVKSLSVQNSPAKKVKQPQAGDGLYAGAAEDGADDADADVAVTAAVSAAGDDDGTSMGKEQEEDTEQMQKAISQCLEAQLAEYEHSQTSENESPDMNENESPEMSERNVSQNYSVEKQSESATSVSASGIASLFQGLVSHSEASGSLYSQAEIEKQHLYSNFVDTDDDENADEHS